MNLGVVGRARQGKSRLLQSITGLSTSEIPDGDRQHCTGVRSTIHHNPSVETSGEVWFYSERSFLNEVIAPYYRELNLGAKPIIIQEFANQELPPLPENLKNDSNQATSNKAKYEHLKRYHVNFDKYSHLLKQESPQRISKQQIREYVAQDSESGERIFFNYLAVKQVKIVCPFPNEDVGQIAVIDLPGLGDTGIGDEEKLIKTLGEDVDFVLFVKMPKSSGDYWADVDVKLYDTATSALINLPLKLWSFMILNETDETSSNGNNQNNCQDLRESLGQTHINVAGLITANCGNSEIVNQLILKPTLNYLTENITKLDMQYTENCADELKQLQSGIKSELEKAKNVLGKIDYTENESKFFKLFNKDFWPNLTKNLKKLCKQQLDERELENDFLKKQIESIFKSCQEDKNILPTLEDIEDKNDEEDSFATVYSNYLHEIRTGLSERFLGLDEGLKESIDQVKTKISNVLIEECKLGGLTSARGVQFLGEITELIPDNLTSLKLGFQIITEYQLSYRGFIQHRIRKHLDKLTPNKTVKLTKQDANEQDVLDYLEELYKPTLFDCRNALDSILNEPSEAAFAMVEEFVDRVLRAKEVKDEWYEFLLCFRAEIWTEDFQILGENTRIREEWLKLIEQAESLNETREIKT